MLADLGRAERGERTVTGMSAAQLREWTGKVAATEVKRALNRRRHAK